MEGKNRGEKRKEKTKERDAKKQPEWQDQMCQMVRIVLLNEVLLLMHITCQWGIHPPQSLETELKEKSSMFPYFKVWK